GRRARGRQAPRSPGRTRLAVAGQWTRRRVRAADAEQARREPLADEHVLGTAPSIFTLVVRIAQDRATAARRSGDEDRAAVSDLHAAVVDLQELPDRAIRREADHAPRSGAARGAVQLGAVHEVARLRRGAPV